MTVSVEPESAVLVEPFCLPLSRPVGPQREARVIAFYLPQFHPIPENDEWWGPGFTEWTNTAKARPLFRGHDQPHLPADLGFYDLRVSETRQAQAQLAIQHGVEAFCYWHYWFAGRRILERPFQEVIASRATSHKFCVGWANQTWTGIWHGAANRTLIEQTYPGARDDEAHFKCLLTAFEDPRYLRVDGKPLFYIFRPEQLPEPQAFARRWREMARAAGLGGIYIVGEISDLLGRGPVGQLPEAYGFDAGVYIRLPAHTSRASILKMRLRRKLLNWPETYRYTSIPIMPPQSYHRDNVHPCVYPNWDNTPRSGQRGLVLRGSSPEAFRPHVRHAVQLLHDRPDEQRLLFIKSWNEWAEGNYLEPDLVHGHGYLRTLDEETRLN